MGFKLPEQTVRLVFEGAEYEGAEVVCRRDVTLGDVLQFDGVGVGSGTEVIAAALKVFSGFIVSWNLEDAAGKPLPLGPDALATLPLLFAIEVISQWTAIFGVSGPLVDASSNGAKPPMEIPVESL